MNAIRLRDEHILLTLHVPRTTRRHQSEKGRTMSCSRTRRRSSVSARRMATRNVFEKARVSLVPVQLYRVGKGDSADEYLATSSSVVYSP